MPHCRLPPEIVHDIADACSLPSLLSLRRTSKWLHAHASEVLQSDRRKLIVHYFPNAEQLWRCLDETHAVVGGLAALLFLLRNPRALPATLDIYVSSLDSDRLEQLMEEDLDLFLTNVEQDTNRLGHHVSRAATFTISATRFITVHTSMSVSALDPIAITPVTALLNWVSPHTFACGYPSLTFQQRCVAAAPTGIHLNLLPLYRILSGLHFELATEPSS